MNFSSVTSQQEVFLYSNFQVFLLSNFHLLGFILSPNCDKIGLFRTRVPPRFSGDWKAFLTVKNRLNMRELNICLDRKKNRTFLGIKGI